MQANLFWILDWRWFGARGVAGLGRDGGGIDKLGFHGCRLVDIEFWISVRAGQLIRKLPNLAK